MVETYESPSGTRFPFTTSVYVENDAVTGRYFDWCVCVFFFTATVHISSEATSPSDLKRVKGIAVGIETCERRKKKKREKKTKR